MNATSAAVARLDPRSTALSAVTTWLARPGAPGWTSGGGLIEWQAAAATAMRVRNAAPGWIVRCATSRRIHPASHLAGGPPADVARMFIFRSYRPTGWWQTAADGTRRSDLTRLDGPSGLLETRPVLTNERPVVNEPVRS